MHSNASTMIGLRARQRIHARSGHGVIHFSQVSSKRNKTIIQLHNKRHSSTQSIKTARNHATSHGSSGVCEHSVRYAPRHILGAQCAFKILMIHEVLQFALRIAFRCVLHRCGSLDIHCRKLYRLTEVRPPAKRQGHR